MPSDLITTAYLGSFAGLVAITYLLVQFFKDPIKAHLNDWWVRMLAVGIALVLQGFTLYVGGHFTVEAVGLAILNSFLVALAAAGAHNFSQPTAAPDPITAMAPDPVPVVQPQVQEVSPPTVKYTIDGAPVAGDTTALPPTAPAESNTTGGRVEFLGGNVI